MSIKIFSNTIDVAVIGLTNSGKSTFITSLVDVSKFNPVLIKELCDNNGGLTKVTTFYELTDCVEPEVTEVEFNMASIKRGIPAKGVECMNKKLNSSDYKNFKIARVISDENGEFEESLKDNLNEFADKIKKDIKFAISIINNKNADKLLRHIKIRLPVTGGILEIMRENSFDTVVLRDTRGFLDTSVNELEKKTPTLADSGLDGIQACILMNGQNSVMPNLGREIYGEFVKAIFEAVPTFIIERSAKLAGKLEDMVDDKIKIDSDIYDNLVKNPRIVKLNFKEMHKFLAGLGVIDDEGNAANQLIATHKRELLLPEVTCFPSNEEIEYDSDEYKIYKFCTTEVFKRLLSSLNEFRTLLNKIITFFDDKDRIATVQTSFRELFHDNLFSRVISEYADYQCHQYQLVRPVTSGYSKNRLLNNLAKGRLLGERGGITTRSGSEYMYGATGVYAATKWNAINILITTLHNNENFVEVIKELIDETENESIINTYISEIQQCLRYVLQNSFTDIWAHFSGYPIIKRWTVKSDIENMRKLWNKELGDKYGEDAIDSVYYVNIMKYMKSRLADYNFNTVDYIRFSQLWQVCCNTIDSFFGCVSQNHSYVKYNQELDKQS
ncbi:hypothetical protein [Inediibacterium massiliense]|uniref:hypothetical protein n=1 Tax=Inediibacterium massiliense TaxID=1658111 RepID=UPI0006B58A0E|nr:hypothetical protein [Inediibacterium massiliense]